MVELLEKKILESCSDRWAAPPAEVAQSVGIEDAGDSLPRDPIDPALATAGDSRHVAIDTWRVLDRERQGVGQGVDDVNRRPTKHMGQHSEVSSVPSLYATLRYATERGLTLFYIIIVPTPQFNSFIFGRFQSEGTLVYAINRPCRSRRVVGRKVQAFLAIIKQKY